MKSCRRAACSMPAKERGFSLIVVLFLIVVVAGLGAFAVRIGAAQQQTVALGLQVSRAAAAANSGIEWGRARINLSAACNQVFPAAQAGMNNFQVTVSCPPAVAHIDGGALSEYTITSTASRGTFGTPDYVSRSVVFNCIKSKSC